MSDLSNRRVCREGPYAVIEWKLHGGVHAVNDTALSLFGDRLKTLADDAFLEWLLAGVHDKERDLLRKKIYAGEDVSSYTAEQLVESNGFVSCEWRHTILTDVDGSRHIVSIAKDLSRQKITEEMLQTLVTGSLPSGTDVLFFIVKNLARILSVRHCLLVVNDEMERYRKIVLAGWSDGRKIKRSSWFSEVDEKAFFHDGILDIDEKSSQELLKSTSLQANYCCVYQIPAHSDNFDGGLFLLDDEVIDVPEESRFLLETLLNRMSIEIAHFRNEKKLELAARIFSETHEAITVTDSEGVIIDVNPAFCQMSGYSKEELLGVNSRILKSGLQSKEFYQDLWRTLTTDGVWQGEFWNRRKNGELYAEHKTITRLVAEDGGAIYYVGLGSDITEQKHQQQALEQMAHFDVLTQLPNRALFADRLTGC